MSASASSLFHTTYSSLTSSLPQSTRKTLPILYIIAGKQYKKEALLRKSIDPSKLLWNEIINHQDNEPIRRVLSQWIIKQKSDEQRQDAKNLLQHMHPLRIVMHELKRCKYGNIEMEHIRPSDGDEIDIDNKSKYFALMWIPCNTKTGFSKHEYTALIQAFNECDYICKPLNKDCVYIDGPEYDWDEYKTFSLAYKCNHYCAETENIKLVYTVIVHEMSVGSSETDDKQQQQEQQQQQHQTAPNPALPGIDEKDEEKVKTQIELQVTSDDINEKKHKVNISQSIQFKEEPLSRQRRLSEIKASKYSILKGTFRSFAFVWIELDDTDTNKQEMIQRKKTNLYPNQTTLPSYAVMKRLHKQPTEEDINVLYNVELMAYDNCWHNLDLVVDRKFQYKDCLLLLLQFLFLPIFVLIPIRYCLKAETRDLMKARLRPSKAKTDVISYFNLDKTEQIPFDISILFRAIPKDTDTTILKEVCFRFWAFILSGFIWSVIVSGPILYHVYNPSIPERTESHVSHVDKLQFFDCYGGLIMYGLTAFTIIWWSCATRVLIGPKQHLLLYHKLMLHRPVSRDNRELNRTDWGALVNLHEPLPETLATFAYKKEFLQAERATDHLIDNVMLKSFSWPICRNGCHDHDKDDDMVVKYSKYILIVIAIIIYMGVQNQENLQHAGYPFYIGTEDTNWRALTAYNVVSSLIQDVFLFGFILLWETMIFRIYAHLTSVKILSQIIIRDTHTEYIEFNTIDNILSWLSLENFVKRKGMTLFSAVETPLLSLVVLAFGSWGATIYCVVQGVGLELKTDNSIFSNSALTTWIYVGLLAFVYAWRVIYAGQKYDRETGKQSRAIKRQCRTEQKTNLTHFLNKDQLSIDQIMAQQSVELLLQHIEHSEVVPKVFGIQFDELLAKAVITAGVSIVPTVISYIYSLEFYGESDS